jgi:hypothetical protein
MRSTFVDVCWLRLHFLRFFLSACRLKAEVLTDLFFDSDSPLVAKALGGGSGGESVGGGALTAAQGPATEGPMPAGPKPVGLVALTVALGRRTGADLVAIRLPLNFAVDALAERLVEPGGV